MDIGAFAGTLTNLLVEHLPRLMRGEDAEQSAGHKARDELPAVVHLLWQRLQPEKAASLSALLNALAALPDPEDIQTLRQHVQQMLSKDLALARSLQHLASLGPGGAPAGQPPRRDPWDHVLTKDRKAARRLEMLYELRTGKTAGEVAARFNISVQDLLALNARFCTAGVAGALNDDAETWLERLNAGDTILRRLDMIYLVRCGTPASAVAEQYGALPEYVERIVRRFEKNGVPGILTEKDIEHFHTLYPPALRVCSYNLHGVDDAGLPRFRRIAAQLAYADAHVAALQEVVSGSDIENTGAQVARWVSSMTGEPYTSEFAYCHQFMEKYPEGIAIATRYRPKATRALDLTELRDGLRPTLSRKALVMEADAVGRTVAVASVHLDHVAEPQVRLAQAEKLVRELEEKAGNATDYFILAGDFNDADDSPAIRFLLSAGYRDAYRACNKDMGNTYPAGNPTARIDYIFVKGAIEIRSSGLLVNDPELSDHIGIFAEIA